MRRREFVTFVFLTLALNYSSRRAFAGPIKKTVGFLAGGSESATRDWVVAFRSGLSQGGIQEGQDVEIVFRWARNRFDALPTMAAELVAQKVDLIVATGTAAALAAKNATSSIPIVFAVGDDPVTAGLVSSLNRPTTNLTGITYFTNALAAKRLELLSDLLPHANDVGVLTNPKNPASAPEISAVAEAAQNLRKKLCLVTASTADEIDQAYSAFSGCHAHAVLIGTDPLFVAQRQRVLGLAARLPTMFTVSEYVKGGDL